MANRYNENKKPTAPYNFISLNTEVVRPPLYQYIQEAAKTCDADDAYRNGYYQFIHNGPKKYTGYFELAIENITPLYIEGKDDEFFSNGREICIPGSSLRGMIKNLFKIITNSSLRANRQKSIANKYVDDETQEMQDVDVTDRRLYFRNVAGKGRDPSKKTYADEFKRSEKKAGFLVKYLGQYYICCAEYEPVPSDAEYKKSKSSKAFIDEAKKNANIGKPCVKWYKNYVNVFSGDMVNNSDDKRSKLRYYKISKPCWNVRLPVPEEVKEDYINDKEKRGGLDLLEEQTGEKNSRAEYKTGKDRLEILNGAEEYTYIVPCFYVAEKGVVKHFGASPFYRISYSKSIADHIPKKLRSTDIDFTDAVFGNCQYWKSRVYVEDSYLEQSKQGKFYRKENRKILGQPKPTSFQFYLDTDSEGKVWDWNGNTTLRGYKMYWHRKVDWRSTDAKQNVNMTKAIAPLKEGHVFKGKIRFENLDDVELGALAYVLSLGKDGRYCYKLGMGKPIGMGSVRLKSVLHIRGEQYYTQLFDENGFAACSPEADEGPFIERFKNYIADKLPKVSYAQYQKRILELQYMMDTRYMDTPSWNEEQTRYMEIQNNGDKEIITDRIPLPTVEEVVRELKKE